MGKISNAPCWALFELDNRIAFPRGPSGNRIFLEPLRVVSPWASRACEHAVAGPFSIDLGPPSFIADSESIRLSEQVIPVGLTRRLRDVTTNGVVGVGKVARGQNGQN